MTDEAKQETFAEVEARLDAEEKAVKDSETTPVDPLAAKPAEDAAAKEAADKAAADAKAKEEADKVAADAAAKAAAEAAPEPTLPLNRHKAILNSERQAREQAETRAADLEERIKVLETKKPGTVTKADIAKLKDDLPEEVVAVLESQQARLDALTEQLSNRDQAAQRATADGIQDVVDADPELSKWQEAALKEGATAADRQMWDEAVVYDRALKSSPAWKDKPLNERFARAAQLVCDDHGMQRTPKAAEASPKPATTEPKPLPTVKPAAPNTLSDVPGGLPPATGKLESFLALDPIAAAASFSRMTDAQFEQAMGSLN